LKNQQEIIRKVNIYKQQLSTAIDEKEQYENKIHPDIDLIIFSLIDKLEVLFWILDMDLPESDLIDRLTNVNH